MRILIDGMNLALHQGTGVATYARNLASCIKRSGHNLHVLYGRNVTAHRNPLLREALFLDTQENRGRSRVRQGYDLIRSLRPLRPTIVPRTDMVLRRELSARLPDCDTLLNEKSLFHKALTKFEAKFGFLEIDPPEPIDVAHWTYPIPIRIRGARNIYTIHDMVPLKLPYATLDQKHRHFRLLKAIVRNADAIVTVSETSRRDIVEMIGADPTRVINTYQSVSLPRALMDTTDSDIAMELSAIAERESQAMDGTFLQRLKPKEFYLFVGAIEPKKNLRRIIEAYLASGVSEPLVVVGRRGWQFETEERMMAASPRIVYLDYAPFSQLVALLRAARALIFPSLYEGFGLPVLEAFLCGAPVVTSTPGSTAEVAGDAALLVDPYDVRQIRDAFRTLSAPESGELRGELASRGRSRAAVFAEEAIAARIDTLHRDVAARRPLTG